MRVILYPNGSVINNSLHVDLVPGGRTQTQISIPGYIAGSLSLLTDLEYEYNVNGDNISISVYVPPTYGASGTASLVMSYATTSIYGNLLYLYTFDGLISDSRRFVTITNNTGSSFNAEIGVSQGSDIYTATDVDYGIVGSLDIMEGSQTYPLESDLYISIIYNVFPETTSVNLVARVSVSGQDPLPGILNMVFQDSSVEVPITSGVTIIGTPENVIDVQQIQDIGQYIISVRDNVRVRVVMNATSVINSITGEDIPFSREDSAILFFARPGSYILK